MSRRWQFALLVVGAALFALVVRQIGVAQIVQNAQAVGWVFVPVLMVYGVAYACNTAAWRFTMSPASARPSFWRTYVITVSGFSLNFVTPMVNAGGEPFRAAAVAPWLGRQRAASSVIVHRMVHTLGLLLTWLTSLVLALVVLPKTGGLIAALLMAALVVSALALLVLRGHRHGILESGLDLLARVPLAGRLAARLEVRRPLLAEMDAQIAELYHEAPGRFFGALACEYTSRVLYAAEYWLICYGVGLPVTATQAYLINGLASLAMNALFFIPFELGSKEGVLYLLFKLGGLDPRVGVYTAIVSRARDMIWIAAGLTLLAVVRHRRTDDATPTRSPAPAEAAQ
jgi:uncharacterized protein (TIRG00374 family)